MILLSVVTNTIFLLKMLIFIQCYARAKILKNIERGKQIHCEIKTRYFER